MTEKNKEPLDLTNALENVGGDFDILREIAKTFYAESGRRMASVEAAIAANEVKDFQLNLHSIKGGVRFFGASDTAELAGQLESRAANTPLSELTPDVERLKASLNEFIEQLKVQLKKD